MPVEALSSELDVEACRILIDNDGDDRADDAVRTGSFRTPADACSLVFGSCIGGQGYGRLAGHGDASGFPIFAAMSMAEPDFFVCNGDIIYADNKIEPTTNSPPIVGVPTLALCSSSSFSEPVPSIRSPTPCRCNQRITSGPMTIANKKAVTAAPPARTEM